MIKRSLDALTGVLHNVTGPVVDDKKHGAVVQLS
jgi:hypothetical protein